jgi:amino acid transporter
VRNIYTFFWVSFAVKTLVFAALNYFFLNTNSSDNKQVLLYAIAALLFAITSFLKFRGARTFGKYLKVTEYEFTFMLASAMALNNLGFGAVVVLIIIEWQLYLKEFCIIKPSENFDGNTTE